MSGVSRVIDDIFPNQKDKYVFNFLDDTMVYSPSEEHVTHLHEILGRLQRARFTLNLDKVTLGAREIKYLGHLLLLWRIKTLPDQIAAIQHYSHPTNLKNVWRFIGVVGFIANLFQTILGKQPNYMS